MKIKLQIHKSNSIANIFVITSLVLLVIYGADVAFKNFNTAGFIPIDTITRGIIFGGIAVAFSIIAFIISIKVVFCINITNYKWDNYDYWWIGNCIRCYKKFCKCIININC